MTIVLVGAPGAGKTTHGRLLAQRLGVDFVDVDELIEDVSAKPIREIFAYHGEAHFRALEREHTLAALEGGGVVALGGGAVTSPEIRAALAGHDVIWLRVSVVQATRRVGMTGLRPLLLGDVRERLSALLTEREPLYAGVATLLVDTDKLSPRAVVDEILRRMGEADEPGDQG